ncbi:MAG: hypothetical protein GWN99_08675 [Gemmatimonadetes bacterium]|uniref:Uncharacterized protein n=1 Tax=Candidatus Kutchimonas denitrificans TaxID=3056748 RepID=A0AAE4ZD27_9BACT|nr:hypothetical protein [Gemmatimonadota bacterium]NIR76571.1 hypothetical protein [Candidatus Kutchimonas denitrificans]NIS01127.1 hypothetical protein [Gemmatimonadota bacterium]NIT66894.1 hypothetical protein [Gemmatimonadota bacterium]NIU54667.1 hypothetical protein [Gemmatimonadota bacterium]
MLVRALAVWLLLFVIAVASGAARGTLLQPRLGEAKAHVVGTLAVVAIFAFVIWLLVPWVAPTLQPARLWQVGLLWLGLTIVFETALARWVLDEPWHKVVDAYNVVQGRIWILVLLTVLIWPSVAGALRR